MTDFILTIIKYTVILLCCLYSYAKLCAVRLKPFDIIFIPLFAAVSVGLFYVGLKIKLIIPIIILAACVAAFWARFKRKFFETVTFSVISFGITIFLMVVSWVASLITGPLLYLIKNEAARDIVYQAVQSILLLSLTLLIYRIKRFRNGIIIYRKDSTFERLILASATCIFGLTLFYTKSAGFISGRIFILVIIAFLSFSLLIWWKRLISANYKTQLQKRNLEVLEQTITETVEERDRLLKENEELSKIIHRDNKMLPALKDAVLKTCGSGGADSELGGMIDNINKLQAERTAAIANYQNQNECEKTGVVTVDAVLAFLRKKAQIQNTEFALYLNIEAVKNLTEKFTEITDLNTLICDLGENALIAVRGGNGKVKVSIGLEDGAPFIKFYDNGKLFDEKVISEMGRTKITTHKDDGGSGIGLLSTFEIMRGNGLSLCIDEALNDENFTKCVGVIADGKCTHRVISQRDSVKRICAEREDFLRA